MKVIDLLKLMLERKAPKRIEVLGFRMNFVPNGHWGDYEDETGNKMSDFRLNECLNDEVEVIEEDKKIEKIDTIDYCHSTDTSKDMVLVEKINEIIKVINEMREDK